MSKAANFCNHKRTSHMTQLTPWRYLEKATHRMGRVTERQEKHRMKVGRGEEEEEEEKEGIQDRVVRKKIYKYGLKPAKCLWQDVAAPSPRHSSLSDRESN